MKTIRPSLRKKCPYSEFFLSPFSHIWTKYGELLLNLHIQSKCRIKGPEKLQIRTLFTQGIKPEFEQSFTNVKGTKKPIIIVTVNARPSKTSLY